MPSELGLRGNTNVIRAFIAFGSASLIVSLLLLIASIFWPMEAEAVDMTSTPRAVDFNVQADRDRDTDALLEQIIERRLIKPAEIVAAVKDDGKAARLLKAIKLQGVVQMGTGYVAYVQIDKQGVKTVKSGDSLLSFSVEKVEPGKVTLTLEGVRVVLGH